MVFGKRFSPCGGMKVLNIEKRRKKLNIVFVFRIWMFKELLRFLFCKNGIVVALRVTL